MTYTTLAKMIEKMTPKEERDRLVGNMVADPAIFRKEGYHRDWKKTSPSQDQWK